MGGKNPNLFINSMRHFGSQVGQFGYSRVNMLAEWFIEFWLRSFESNTVKAY